MIRKMKKHTFYPKGGTTLITVRQAAEGIVGAIEKIEVEILIHLVIIIWSGRNF